MESTKALTLSLLAFLQNGVQPFLLVFCILGHAHKPLVFGRVVNLPPVGHSVVVAMIISWGNNKKEKKQIENPAV